MTHGATVTDHDWLSGQFEANRERLRGVAYRLLGSLTDADDALQEAWLRVSRSDAAVENPGGWLTTVVSRVCLNMLAARCSLREDSLDRHAPGPVGRGLGGPHSHQPNSSRVGSSRN